MVVTFGAVQGTRWAGRKAAAGVQVELLEGVEDSLRSSYKYMFQRLRDVRNGKSLPVRINDDNKSHYLLIPFIIYTQIELRVDLCLKLNIASTFSVLTDKIDELGESLRSHFSIEEVSPVSLPAQVHTC